MKKVSTSQEMYEIDKRTIDEYGFPSIALMENAGQGVVEILTRNEYNTPYFHYQKLNMFLQSIYKREQKKSSQKCYQAA